MATTPEEQEALAQTIFLLDESLQDRMQRGLTLAEAYNQLVAAERAMFGHAPAMLQFRLDAMEEARKRAQGRLDAVSFWTKVAVRCGRPDWYGGPGPDATIWQALQGRLKSQQRTSDELDGVDHDSTAVVSLLDNPGLPVFSTKGLVIGHVQSGKTGNMAAVIAKAADTRFKFFVVLSGMTDTLRNQTQRRLDADLIESGNPDRWFRWTQADRLLEDGTLEKGDFDHPSAGGFLLDGPKNHLAVIKKNAGILRRFQRKLKATPRVVLEQTSFVIIDDECDQASVNSAQLRKAISAINRLIREIVEQLPRVAYVGYTATPFANVLINPNEKEDLYPRDFIHPLGKPASYFGAVELFGRDALDGEDPDGESGHDMIRIVPDPEAKDLRPSGRKSGFQFSVTEALETAIAYFILATAAREFRGQADEHSTMLIHTSMLNSVHRLTKDAVGPHLAQIRNRLNSQEKSFLESLKQIWEEESDRVPSAEFGLEPVTFNQIQPLLDSVARSIDIKVENWSSDDRIDYTEPGRRYIVIGGNVLARGLTLEGLLVSFFMRTSSQYDTLMQMGRWFGYRRGFADLPRVWMEKAVRDAFFDLATVEEEIRRDARHFADENKTPLEFAVRIRKIPGLAITARAKMRDAKTAQVGYEGEHLQTIRFRRHDSDWLTKNWQAGATLVNAPGELRKSGTSTTKFGVASSAIVEFISRYDVEGSASLRRDLLLAFLKKKEGDALFSKWNVVVVGGSGHQESLEPLGALGKIRLVNRSPLKDSGEVAFIKALMSRRDLLADFNSPPAISAEASWDEIKLVRHRAGMPPMLILYPIDRNSAPVTERSKRAREQMDAEGDILGLAIAFPGEPGSGSEYVQADIQPEDAEEEFIGEDALPQELINVTGE